MTETPPNPRRWLRRSLIAGTVLVALALVIVAAIPWWLATESGRRWLLAQSDAALAPGRLELGTLSFSWFGPTRMTRFVLRDGRGKAVVDAPRAVWDRNLYQAIFQKPTLGRLTLDGATIDAERSADGTVDLYETLRPVMKGDPRLSLRVIVRAGRIRFASPELKAPVDGQPADLDLTLAPRPAPMTWHLVLGGEAGPRLRSDGAFNSWQQREGKVPDLAATVDARAWPFDVAFKGIDAAARLDGKAEARREGGWWRSAGDLRLLDLALAGPALNGDAPRFDAVGGVWDVAETAQGWSARTVDLTAPFARLQAQGASPEAAKVEGQVDLVALAGHFRNTLRLRDDVQVEGGTARLSLASVVTDAGPRIDVSARLAALKARHGEKRLTLDTPATLAARLARGRDAAYQLERLTAETPYVKATAEGDLANGSTTLKGTFDLAGLQAPLREVVDLGALELAGAGTFQGDYRTEAGAFRARWQTELRSLRVRGVAPGPIERESARMTVDVDGPLGATGWPSGWGRLGSQITSGDVRAELTANSAEAGGKLSLHAPVGSGDRRAVADLAVDGRWRENGLDLNHLDASLAPVAPDDPREPIRLAARGRYDRTQGRLHVERRGDAPETAAVALGDDGLTVSGLGRPDQLRVDGSLAGDLARLAAWLPGGMAGLEGTWDVRLTGTPGPDGSSFGGELHLDNLAMPRPEGRTEPIGPLAATVQGRVASGTDRLELSEVVLRSPYVLVEASGRLDEPSGRRQLALTGRVVPDWPTLTDLLARRVEPGAKITGRPHPWKLSMRLDEGWRDSIDGEVGLLVDSADIFGLSVGPTPLQVRARKGNVIIDPLTIPVNGGSVYLEPEFVSDEAGPKLQLGPGSTIRDVQINEVVSHRVLAFVAPVLDNATRVRGRVSADLDEAVFPLSGPRTVAVEGSVLFQDVEFTPGPFLDPLMGLIGRADRPLVRLDQPVELSIADRRVYQRGLSVPIGKLSRIDMEGYVDFDKNLNMVASIPVIPPGLADKPVIGDIAGAAMIRVPIRGTLQKPEVDKEQFNLGMKEMGKSVLERSMTRGAVGLFDLLTRPRDPNTPPPQPRLTPAERREQRLRKQAERRQRRMDR